AHRDLAQQLARAPRFARVALDHSAIGAADAGDRLALDEVHHLVDVKAGVRLAPPANTKGPHRSRPASQVEQTVSLVHTNGRGRCKTAVRTHAADSVPGVGLVRRLSFTLVALEEPGHEELLRERRELHAPRLTVLDHLVRIVEID